MDPLRVFFSYCHADEALRDSLAKHLSPMVRERIISPWHDRCIEAGQKIDSEISKHLEESDIILLLVSADFIHSDYCYSREMMKALEKDAAGSARVIPVIVRYCDWQKTPLGKLNALPTDGKAVKSYADIDEALLDVAKGIRRAAETLRLKKNVLPSRVKNTKAPEITPANDKARNDTAEPLFAKQVKLPKKFTDLDKDRFISTTFSTTVELFKNSLNLLETDNPDYKCDFQMLDNKKFQATIYDDGKAIAKCYIRQGSMYGGHTEQILYSSGSHISFGDNSCNKILTVEDDRYNLFVRSTMGHTNDNMSPEKAAEYLWDDFISRIS